MTERAVNPVIQSFIKPINDFAYHFLKKGEGTPRYVMLHANGFNGGTYQTMLNRLVEGAEGISEAHDAWLAPDFRGHGGSYDPGHIESWEDFAEDLARWKSAGVFDRPILIGHSLGGIAALLYEAAHPGSCEAIVLLDPVMFTPQMQLVLWFLENPLFRHWHPMVKLALSRREEFPDLEALAKIYSRKATFRTWSAGVLEDYLKWGTKPSPQGVRLSCRKEIEAEVFSNWPDHVWKVLKDIQCPVLILRGGDSRTFVSQALRRVLHRLPHAEGFDIKGAGHFLPMEQPQKVAQAIRDWAKYLKIKRSS